MQNLLQFSSKIAATFFVLLAIMTMPTLAVAQTYENFDNLILGSTPDDGSYIGNNGNPWIYYNCRGDVPITGKAITLGAGAGSSNLTCSEITGYLFTLKFDFMQVGSELATVIVQVNDLQVASFTTSQEGVVVNSGPISIGGLDVEVKFLTSAGGKEMALDNISWLLDPTPDNFETFNNLEASDDFDYGYFTGENNHV